jgi:dihydroxyacetone kinase
MELGMGIHGESGAQQLKLLSSRQAIDLALGQLLVNSRTLNLNPDDNVVLFVNNLGLSFVLFQFHFFIRCFFRRLFKS